MRDLIRTDHITDPENLVSLFCEPLPAGDMIVIAAGELRREPDGRWRFWQDPAWIPSDFEESPIPVFKEKP